jgi:phosphatidylglycerol:prolipoprotein diacylglycerol transferase
MLTAIVVSFLVLQQKIKDFGITKEQLWDLVLWLVIGGIVGARVYEVLFVDFSYYVTYPSEIIKIWHGGLAIHGAWFGGIVVAWLQAKKFRLNFLKILDSLSLVMPLGQAIGRWGNYFNQELYGLPTGSPWGIPISLGNRVVGFEQFTHFHPTFLYESIGNLLIFFVLLFFYKKKSFSGQLLIMYIGLYSVLRLSLEFIRLDPAFMVYGIRWPILFSVLCVIGSVLGYGYLYKKNHTT